MWTLCKTLQYRKVFVNAVVEETRIPPALAVGSVKNNEGKKTYEENLVNLQEDIQKDAEEVKQVCIYQKEKRIAENALRLEES